MFCVLGRVRCGCIFVVSRKQKNNEEIVHKRDTRGTSYRNRGVVALFIFWAIAEILGRNHDLVMVLGNTKCVTTKDVACRAGRRTVA